MVAQNCQVSTTCSCWRGHTSGRATTVSNITRTNARRERRCTKGVGKETEKKMCLWRGIPGRAARPGATERRPSVLYRRPGGRARHRTYKRGAAAAKQRLGERSVWSGRACACSSEGLGSSALSADRSKPRPGGPLRRPSWKARF